MASENSFSTDTANGSAYRRADGEQQVIRVRSDEMLQQVADELAQYIPQSLPALGPIRCHQSAELLYDFYIDQWPSLNMCVAVLQPKYFHKMEKPPYTIMSFFGRTNSLKTIEQMLNGSNVDWNTPLIVYFPNTEQTSALCSLLERRGTVHSADVKFVMAYVERASDIKFVPLAADYEYIKLTSADAEEVCSNWAFTNGPFLLQDVDMLMERLTFRGLRHTPSGMLVAQGGQLHPGVPGLYWVHPEHRGKKLCQALASRHAMELIERYGFVYVDIRETNVASRTAFKNTGFHQQEGHLVHLIYFTPSQTPPQGIVTWHQGI